jgi:hypothetical protein
MIDNLTLYHYTSIAGLNSIVRSGKVWASDCRYLNDQRELARAVEMFLEKFEGVSREILSWAFHWHNFSRCHCVFSLSRSPKVLSQWRAYAEDGRGAAIGFNAKNLSGRNGNLSRSLVDCVYEDHEGFIEGLISQSEQEVEDLLRMHEEARALNTFWQAIENNPKSLEILYCELLRIKNPAFAEEQEVRLVINVPARLVQTRVAGGLIIPYVEHEFVEEGDRDYLSVIVPEIWLGPKSDERNMHALTAVFQQLGWVPGLGPGLGLHKYDCGYI